MSSSTENEAVKTVSKDEDLFEVVSEIPQENNNNNHVESSASEKTKGLKSRPSFIKVVKVVQADQNIIKTFNQAKINILSDSNPVFQKQNSKLAKSKFQNYNSKNNQSTVISKEELKKLNADTTIKGNDASMKRKGTIMPMPNMSLSSKSVPTQKPLTKLDSIKQKFHSFNRQMSEPVIQIALFGEDEEDSILNDNIYSRYGKFVIHPYSMYRQNWDYITSFFVIFVCLSLPVTFSFEWIDWTVMDDVENFLTLWFAIDLCLNFFTGFVHKGVVIMSRKKIAYHYLWSWFFVDLLGTIPFELIGDVIIGNQGNGSPGLGARKALKIVKYFKLPKLLRISRLLKRAREYGKFFAVLGIAVGFFMTCHFFACGAIWIHQPCVNVYDVFNNIVTPITNDPILINYCDDPIGMYFNLHYAFNGLMLGISDVNLPGPYFPYVDQTAYARGTINYNGTIIYKYVVQLLGFFFCVMFVGNAVMLVSSKLSQSWSFRMKMERINRDMDDYNVPEDLQFKVKNYYDYLWVNQKNLSDSLLINDADLSEV